MHQKRILFVDDDEIQVYILSNLTQKLSQGVEFISVDNGFAAIEYLKTCNGNYPDLILLDLNMPIMDGFGFLDIYERDFLPFRPLAKVVMLTSSVRDEDKKKSVNYKSIYAFYNKPIKITEYKELLEIIEPQP